jgi:hypothetical protein
MKRKHHYGKCIRTLIEFPDQFKRYLKSLAGTRRCSLKEVIISGLEVAYPAWRDQMMIDADEAAYTPRGFKDSFINNHDGAQLVEEDTPTNHKEAPYNPHADMYEKPEQAAGYSHTKGIRSKNKFYIKKPKPHTILLNHDAAQTLKPGFYSDVDAAKIAATTKAKREAEDAAILKQLEDAANPFKLTSVSGKPKPHQNTRRIPKKTPVKSKKKR